MKKFFTMAAIALFTMTSCSSDDAEPTNPENNNPVEEITLPKKLIIQYPTYSYTILYNYDASNQLTRIDYVDNGGHLDYTYADGLITESKDYSNNGELQFKETYEYGTNGKLATYKFYNYGINNDEVYKRTYSYNQDGTVTMMRYTGDANTQTEWNDTTVYTISGGNITQMNISSPNADVESFILTYDNKNNPYKNIPGYDVVQLTHGGISNFNNRLTMTSDSYMATSAYTYNDMGYPVSMTHTTSLQQDYVEQYFYE